MKFVVTKKDIENGLRCNPRNCPINHSMTRRLKGKTFDIYVGGSKIRIVWGDVFDSSNIRDYDLPSNAINFINNFDSPYPQLNSLIKPFSFGIPEIQDERD